MKEDDLTKKYFTLQWNELRFCEILFDSSLRRQIEELWEGFDIQMEESNQYKYIPIS